MEQEKKEKQKQNKDEAKKESWYAKFKKMDTKKKIQYAVILLITIVILAIFFGTSGTSTDTPTDTAPTINQDISDSIEEKLKETLSRIDGAGRVEVMITYESSAILNPAISIDTQSSTTQDQHDNGNSVTESINTQREVVTVSGNNGNQALVLSEQSPEIKGVIVIAEGADKISVKLNLLSAVQTVLNVEPEKVDVYKMNIE